MYDDPAENYAIRTNRELARVGGVTPRDGVMVCALARAGRPNRPRYETLWRDVEGLDRLWKLVGAEEAL